MVKSKFNNYDRIAWCYDLLCSIMFGNSIRKAQIEMLNFIPGKSNILIIGGGTGWIIEEISKVHQSGLYITYIDASEKMIEKSKRREARLNKVEFISSPIEQVHLKPHKYDVIITAFFFDNFSQSKCGLIFNQLNTSLKNYGTWLYADFKLSYKKRQHWQKRLLNLMYLFFKIFCRLEAEELPDIKSLFVVYNYEVIIEKSYYKDFIFSTVFKVKDKKADKTIA